MTTLIIQDIPFPRVGKYLAELSENWCVSLESTEGGIWYLTLIPSSRFPLSAGHGQRSHSFYGSNLGRVVAAAWAGEPEGEVK